MAHAHSFLEIGGFQISSKISPLLRTQSLILMLGRQYKPFRTQLAHTQRLFCIWILKGRRKK